MYKKLHIDRDEFYEINSLPQSIESIVNQFGHSFNYLEFDSFMGRLRVFIGDGLNFKWF